MRRIALALLLSLLLPAAALAQGIGLPFYPLISVPGQTLVGRSAPNSGPVSPIPFSVLKALFIASGASETAVADANYTMVAADSIIVYTSISTARTVTLLPASTFAPGTQKTIFDRSGSASGTNTISIAPNGLDNICIVSSCSNVSAAVVVVPYTATVIESDGLSKWTVVAGPINASGITSGSLALTRIAAIAADTYLGNATGSSAAPTAVSRSNCTGNSSALQYSTSSHTEGCKSDVASLTVADQTLAGGANVTSLTQSTGNITVDSGARPLQFITNNGAFTITAPTNDGSMLLLVTNGASASTITFSGFSVGSNTGDALDTTNGHKFTISIWRINSVAGYRVAAHQ